MNRRQLLQGVLGLGAGLLLPPSVADGAEEGRRIWALGAVPSERVQEAGRITDAAMRWARVQDIVFARSMCYVPVDTAIRLLWEPIAWGYDV